MDIVGIYHNYVKLYDLLGITLFITDNSESTMMM